MNELVFFCICSSLEIQAAVSILEKKGAVKIEENQKLYKHMERGKSHLCNQRLSAPVPCHVQSDGLVCGIAVRGDSLWGAAAL